MAKVYTQEDFARFNKRRKTVAGGFKDPEVRKKALEARKKNKAKDVQSEAQLLQDSETGQK